MASTIVTSLVKLTAKLLSSFGSSTALAVAEQLDKLKTTVGKIRALLADAEKREIREESIKLWLFELKQVAYDAEDILSDIDYELLRLEMERGLQIGTRKRKHEQAIRQPPPPPPPPSTSSSSSWSSPSISSFFFGAPEEHEKHKRPARRAQAPVTDAAEMETMDEPVKLWHSGSKQVAYAPEVMLSDFDYETMSIDMDQSLHISSLSSDKEMREVTDTNTILYSSLDASFLQDLLRRVKDVMGRFDEINKARVTLGLREEDGVRRVENNFRRATSSYADLSEIYGRLDEKDEIVNALLSDEEHSEHHIPVVSIVAMGGMGKTTLAKLVYNDQRVKEHFELKSWVWVSEVYDEIKLTRAIVESATNQACSLTEHGVLRNKLKNVLQGRRFLLILDDMWNEDPVQWETLQASLVVGAKGSKVVITARNENVASIMGSKMLLRLGKLPSSHSWALFCQHAFSGNQVAANSRIVAIGQNIVERCKGVPLTIKTFGGLLSSETSEECWDEILTSDVWDLDEGEENILRVLRLSYHYMPPPLKPCFTYCAIFPKGHEFEMESLVRMWVAQGFVQTEDVKQMEEIGRAYVHDLLQRSFFQDPSHFEYKLNFTMHDLMHDLAKWTAGEESLSREYVASCDISSDSYVRHLSVLVKGKESVSVKLNCEHNALRSLSLRPAWDYHFCLDKDFFSSPGLQYLRVLDLKGSGIPEVPEAIGSIKQLRYLGLSGTRIKRLPESVCNLYNLQSLDLQFCNRLTDLPRGMRRLISLRHLCIHNKHTAPNFVSFLFKGEKLMMPAGIGRLIKLQTLPLFVVSQEEGYATIPELRDLNDLQGKLSIVDLHNITHDRIGEAKMANLKSKEHLTWLVLKWHNSMSFAGWEIGDDEAVLEGLQPHTSIQYLEIEGYKCPKFPTWVGHPSFVNIVDVQLSHCVGCEQLPALGQLPSLKLLDVSNMFSLQHVGPEFYGDMKVSFPSLLRLRFKNMPNWEKWLNAIEERHVFRCLESLSISKCPKIASISLFNLSGLKELRIDHCNQLTYIEGLDTCWLATKHKTELSSSETSRFEECSRLKYLENGRLPKKLEIAEIVGCPSFQNCP